MITPPILCAINDRITGFHLSDDLIQISDLSFSHGDRLLYDKVSLTIPRGKITAFMGPSGIGKTTLLRLIGGQIRPDQGQILFDGQNVPELSRGELYSLRKRMSMLFQSGALFTGLTVFDNVAFPLREHTSLPEELIRTLVLMKLECVGLRGAAYLMPSELSGGMARRAALARAIALDPELIMYDEPFAGQDPITMAVLVKLISQLNKTLGITSVIVSHDVTEVLSIAITSTSLPTVRSWLMARQLNCVMRPTLRWHNLFRVCRMVLFLFITRPMIICRISRCWWNEYLN